MTIATGSIKPAKPKGCPLTPHPRGQWCKKIKGKLHYFGPWADREGAVARYRAVAMALHAGSAPVQATNEAMTVRDLVNWFLASRQSDVTPKTMRSYRGFGSALVARHGARPVHGVGPDEWATLIRELAATWGPWSRRRFVVWCRVMSRWGTESRHLSREIHFGPDFRGPAEREIRSRRTAATMLSPDECRRLLDASTDSPSRFLRPCILLALNAGFGQTDCSALRGEHVDGRVIVFPRPKTGIARRCWLWHETADAIAGFVGKPNASVFATATGEPLVHGTTDALGQAFAKLLVQCGIVRDGLGFYAMRRTFRTLADDHADRTAINLCMGHTTPGVGDTYVRSFDDKRLRSVAEHVHGKLFKRACRAGRDGAASKVRPPSRKPSATR